MFSNKLSLESTIKPMNRYSNKCSRHNKSLYAADRLAKINGELS